CSNRSLQCVVSSLIVHHLAPFVLFFFIHPAPTQIYTLSLHDALPICSILSAGSACCIQPQTSATWWSPAATAWRFGFATWRKSIDRKSTRLNSSHDQISYAVFCLKKKK